MLNNLIRYDYYREARNNVAILSVAGVTFPLFSYFVSRWTWSMKRKESAIYSYEDVPYSRACIICEESHEGVLSEFGVFNSEPEFL